MTTTRYQAPVLTNRQRNLLLLLEEKRTAGTSPLSASSIDSQSLKDDLFALGYIDIDYRTTHVTITPLGSATLAEDQWNNDTPTEPLNRLFAFTEN